MLSKSVKQTILSLWVAVAALAIAAQVEASTIAQWTFEGTLPATAGPFSAEVGVGSASGGHASGAAVYSTPAGNGSSHSFSSNNWSVGDYYQFAVSTTGLKNIQLSWDQTSSGTGPRDYVLQYSTNGSTFSNFGGTYAVQVNGAPNAPWNATTASSLFSYSQDLSSIVALNNTANIYIRLAQTSATAANGGGIGTAGTDRVDNFTISGSPVPEPSTCVLACISVLGLVAVRGRRLMAARASQA